MKLSYEIRKAFTLATVVGVILAGLFMIAKSDKVTANSVTSADYTLFKIDTTPLTQTQTQGGPLEQQIMSNVNTTAMCLYPYSSVRTFTQNTTRIGSVTDLNYYYIIQSWGVSYPEQGTMSSVLSKPALYDINCWANAPQVQWR